jgi:hypothetical protein
MAWNFLTAARMDDVTVTQDLTHLKLVMAQAQYANDEIDGAPVDDELEDSEDIRDVHDSEYADDELEDSEDIRDVHDSEYADELIRNAQDERHELTMRIGRKVLSAYPSDSPSGFSFFACEHLADGRTDVQYGDLALDEANIRRSLEWLLDSGEQRPATDIIQAVLDEHATEKITKARA